MSFRSWICRSLAFTAAYVVATYAGRLTVMDQTNLSLVWPAAGVSVLWFLAQCRSRWWLCDAVALSAVTVVINMVTGAPVVLAMWFVVANLVQVFVFVRLFRRWLPELWGGGGRRPLSRPHELWRLTAAALTSTLCGAVIGATGLWAASGAVSWAAAAVWLTRNTVSVLVIGAVGVNIGASLQGRRLRGGVDALRAWWAAVPGARRLEYAAVMLASAAVYAVVFGVNHRLPMAFVVISVTVWAGSRLGTMFVAVHNLVFGSVAVLCTLNGNGVFAQIPAHPARALVAQAFVGMIAVCGLSLALGREERGALVDRLRTAEHAAARQAAMMTAIVESMTEGLTVVDDQGRFLLRNPAVGRLMGGFVSTSDRMAQPDFYGLFHPDGRPLTPDDMPYRRALNGTDVHDMDILVRNPGVSDGRVLSVSAAALPDDGHGNRYAVSVFHDVTAERRHRDALASFAGVVAHDLVNPLATIEGWSELLAATDARHAPDFDEVADAARRIRRAAARMRTMINDLLEYTTAREAATCPTMINLGDLLNDIAIARIDQAHSNATAVPSFSIGDLQPVYADPVLTRQLFENLISNAIKYTASGVTPHITVTTEPTDTRVTVTVDDNGIGIPAGQHQKIFENFQRAHRAAGYTGTGLGLAICKRIVERHGGTIGAADNPAGPGSRFTFTLPADATTATRPPSDEPAPPPPREPAAAPAPERADSEAGDSGDAVPGAIFGQAAHLVLGYLHDQMPLAFWAVTRVENGRQTYLYLDADNGYGLRQGQSHPWSDSFCIHMAAGRAPMVALDAQQIPAYAEAGVNKLIDIGTYAGAAITEPDGTLFGAICGLDPHTHTGDARLATAEPLLVLLGRLLTTALAADRAHHRSTTALTRQQLTAETDALTGLPNRRAWQRLVQQAQTHHQQLADPTVIAVLDLDNLKTINDGQGHAAGDAHLIAAATAMRRALPDTDIVARLGGDEFGFLLNNCTEHDAPQTIARIHHELRTAGIDGSIGWASVTHTDGFAAAFDQADVAMYAAKQHQRGRKTASADQTTPSTGRDG